MLISDLECQYTKFIFIYTEYCVNVVILAGLITLTGVLMCSASVSCILK